MKKYLLTLIVVMMCLIPAGLSVHADNDEQEFDDSTVIAVMKPRMVRLVSVASVDDESDEESDDESSDVPDIFDGLGIKNAENLNVSSSSGISLYGTSIEEAVYKLTLEESGTDNVLDIIDKLNELDEVEYAQPNYIYRLDSVPNDPEYSNQYGLIRIKAPKAWDLGIDSSSVAVAIVDSGMMMTHEDLAANLWTNPNEIAGDGKDNDGNGYKDDIHGWDFTSTQNNGKGDNSPDDEFGHGTHVAGIISAVTNNGIGVASVAGNAKLVPLKVFDASGSSSTDILYRAYDYIYTMGFKIANNSLGGSGDDTILKWKIERCSNTLFVVAAGNDYKDIDDSSTASYPAAFDCDNIMSIASTNSSDQLSRWYNNGVYAGSNYGVKNVDIAAPGSAIYSTYYPNSDSYAKDSGTSMACPMVTSVAAALLAKYPSLTPEEIKARLESTADVLSALSGYVKTSGRLNAYAALVTDVTLSGGQDLYIGDTLTMTASIEPAMPTGESVKWTSSDENVATVNSSGVVTAVDYGTTVITASCGGGSDTYTLTVQHRTPKLTLDEPNITLVSGINYSSGEPIKFPFKFEDYEEISASVLEASEAVTTGSVTCGSKTVYIGDDGTGYIQINDVSGDGTISLKIPEKAATNGDKYSSEATTSTVTVDGTAPSANISYSTTSPTNQNVTATLINISDDVDVTNIETAHTFSDNGSYTFTLTDSVGNQSEITAKVDWIDRTPPTAEVKYSTTSPTNQNVTATLTEISEDIQEEKTSYTFIQNGDYTFTLTDKAGNVTEITAAVNWIDKTAPTATVEFSTLLPTNGDVTATLTEISEKIQESERSHTFTENGSYTFTLTDEVGNYSTITVNVDWIDRTPPTAKIEYSPDSPTNGNVTATLTEISEDIQESERSYTFTDNGSYTFTLTDKAGNVSEITANVDWIDRTPPTADVEYSTESPTNENVTVTLIDISEDLQDSETSYTFTENGEYTFKISDKAGNITEIPTKVDWIDKTPPTADFEYSTTSPTNGDVTVTLKNISEDIQESERSHTFKENGSYTFTLTDAVGNVAKLTATVNWIDKTPPTAEVEFSSSTLTNQNVTATLVGLSEKIKESEISHTFTDNGEYTFTLTDMVGNVTEIPVKVNWIDKEPPTGTVSYSTTEAVNTDVIATLNVSKTIKPISMTHTFEENGTYTFEFEDLAGNKGSVTADVNWIDTTAPKVEIQYSTTELTNGNVTVTVIPSEEVTDDSVLTHTFEENGTYTFVIKDLVGNTTEAPVTVNWIDKTPLTATVIYSTNSNTVGEVVATVIPSKTVSQDELTYTFVENGTYTFTLTDLTGNEITVTAEVDYITPVDRLKYEMQRDNENNTTNVTAKLIFKTRETPPQDEEVRMYIAYRKDGELKRVDVVDDVTNMTAEFTVPDDMADCDVSVYVWDEKQAPLMDVQPFTNTAANPS